MVDIFRDPSQIQKDRPEKESQNQGKWAAYGVLVRVSAAHDLGLYPWKIWLFFFLQFPLAIFTDETQREIQFLTGIRQYPLLSGSLCSLQECTGIPRLALEEKAVLQEKCGSPPWLGWETKGTGRFLSPQSFLLFPHGQRQKLTMNYQFSPSKLMKKKIQFSYCTAAIDSSSETAMCQKISMLKLHI